MLRCLNETFFILPGGEWGGDLLRRKYTAILNYIHVSLHILKSMICAEYYYEEIEYHESL